MKKRLKKTFSATLILLFTLLFSFPTQARRTDGCACQIAISILHAQVQRDACIKGCEGNRYCVGYCKAYYELQVENALSTLC